MKTKIAILILILAACLAVQAASAGAIKIYLPREVNISGESMVLGDVAIIRGVPEDVAKASGIMIGKFSVAGQKITVNRSTILSRLAANKIPAKYVSFSGSKDVKVGRKEIIISAKDIAAKASEFLKGNKMGATIASYDLTRGCRDIVLPSQKGEIEFVPRLSKSPSVSQAIVDVDIMLDGKKIDAKQVAFRPMYKCRRIIAKTDIPAGSVLGSSNIKVETITSKYPEPKGWKLPVGLITKRSLKSGQQIRNSLLTRAKPEILIKRNALVVIKIESAALTLTAKGKAIGEGAFGEMIRVKNIDSDRIIICKVNFDGTVSPAI